MTESRERPFSAHAQAHTGGMGRECNEEGPARGGSDAVRLFPDPLLDELRTGRPVALAPAEPGASLATTEPVPWAAAGRSRESTTLMRAALKTIIRRWPWPLTRNERYDRQTRAVLTRVCSPDSSCVDVGCFQGDVLRAMMDAAPQARHVAFEPSPAHFSHLQATFAQRATIHPFALGNQHATTSFNYVVSNPSYSGLRRRRYPREERVEEIQVELRRLDEVLDPALPVHLIKIDVEGGEYDVLRGASATLDTWRPYLIFEHGVGGADRYGVAPGDLFDLLVTRHDYQICLMSSFLERTAAACFTRQSFEAEFWSGRNYYFLGVARPRAGRLPPGNRDRP